MRGFTTVRDLGGPAFGLKRAIDEGVVVGPRIYPSGAIITVTSGHGDFRQPFDLPRKIGNALTRMEQLGASVVADSPDEVRVRAREQLMLGATQIKLTGGGGVASPHSPLDVTTFTEPELRAAVEAADNWGTYVTVHAYTPASIQRAIAAGAKCIEHGHLMDEPTAKLMAERGIWLSIQPFPDEMADGFPRNSQQRAKAQEVLAGTDIAYRLARKYKLKTAFGTDILFSPALAKRQGQLLTTLVRWYSPAEALIMATGTNAELLALCGKRNPYPGKLGVIEEGALADLLLVDGNPIENIKLIEDPGEEFCRDHEGWKRLQEHTPEIGTFPLDELVAIRQISCLTFRPVPDGRRPGALLGQRVVEGLSGGIGTAVRVVLARSLCLLGTARGERVDPGLPAEDRVPATGRHLENARVVE